MKHPSAVRVRAAQLYRDGESITTVAKLVGVDRKTVTAWLRALDPSMRQSGESAPIDPARLADVLAGLPCIVLGQRWAIHTASAHKWITVHGLHEQWAAARAAQTGTEGVCAAPSCENVFTDLPLGRRREYCSPRCRTAAKRAGHNHPGPR